MDNRIRYDQDIEIRNVDIMGESNWYWVKGDDGGFGDATDGPMRDWIDSHSTKYYEHLKDRNTVITGGAACGMHVRFYAKDFKHVIAFEPDPRSFFCMCLNNPYENVVKLNAAIGRGHGIIGIARNPTNIGSNMVVPPTETHHVPMMTIDSLNVDACDLLQLDVEGYEEHALLGAQKTIEKYKPVIVLERFGSLEQQVFMDNLGYKLQDRSFMDVIYIPKD